VQWLRDGLKLFVNSSEVEALADRSDPEQPVLFVPAFVGLGAPYWIPEARGVLFGLTRGTTGADLARAALEGVAYQVADLIEAAGKDAGTPLRSLRVDGGMARNARFLQYQADVVGIEVLAAPHAESTALGAAYLAGLKAGVWPNLAALQGLTSQSRAFQPQLARGERERRLRQWRKAIAALKMFYEPER
jgi:glycerol kinase